MSSSFTTAKSPIANTNTAVSAPMRLLRRVKDSLPEGRAIAEDVWQRRHRGMIVLLWLHVIAIAVYALVMGQTVGHSLFEASIVASAAIATRYGPKDRRFQSVAATFGLTIASAILVHLSGGLIELHFHYFVTLAVVSLYHDWAPFLFAIGFVAIQHGAVGVLDPHSVYNHADGVAHPWRWAGIHAAFVLAASAVSLVRWKSSEIEALKDPLTGLPNRALFGDRLRQALIRGVEARTVAVLFLDVDDFKAINDTAGHTAGDRLLIVIADRLREAVRPADTVARLGGDEFAIVLEHVDEAEASDIAQRILDALRAPLIFDGRRLSVTGSIGIAIRGDDKTGEAELVRNADIAMYVAKKDGKGRFSLFEPSMHLDVIERTELAKDLENAVAQGETHLLYQPVTDILDGKIVGFEALIRWQHPRLGAIGPVGFIPLAEDTGEIVRMGRWVLDSACMQARSWIDRYPSEPPRWISVNVSVRQLLDPEFTDHVLAALRNADLPPELLVLELTESAMMGDDPATIQHLHGLKALGVRIALDDFGTGYSSLGYLRRLPIDILKIDKTFVDGIDRGAEDAALARAVLKIAESMGLECVAEGIERETQAAELRTSGCKFGQGYRFSRPVEARHIDALLQWNPATPQPRSTVMVVDANRATRVLVTTKLRESRFATIEADTGADALDVLQARAVDLIVIDSRLPDMPGVELAVRIRTDRSIGHVPIMFVSGDTSHHADVVGLGGHRDHLMRTPLPAAELVAKIESLIPAAAAS